VRKLIGALPSVGGFLAGTALQIGNFRNEPLSFVFFGASAVCLVIWAASLFWIGVVELRSEMRMDRFLTDRPGLSLSIEPDSGRISANAIVTGRIWFQQPVVIDTIYVLFWQRRRLLRFWRTPIIRAPLGGASAEMMGLKRDEPFSEMRLDAGQLLRFDKSLFVELFAPPIRPPRRGKFQADMYIDLLLPHRSVRVRLGDERVQSEK